MTISPRKLKEIGNALYGEKYKRPMARDLKTLGHKIDEKQIRIYAAGDAVIPGALELAIFDLVEVKWRAAKRVGRK